MSFEFRFPFVLLQPFFLGNPLVTGIYLNNPRTVVPPYGAGKLSQRDSCGARTKEHLPDCVTPARLCCTGGQAGNLLITNSIWLLGLGSWIF